MSSTTPVSKPTAASQGASDGESQPLGGKRRPATDRRAAQKMPVRFLAIIIALGSAATIIGYRYVHTAAEMSAALTLLGNIDVRQVDLSFKVGGRIASLEVDEGDQVAAGQTLAALDLRYFDDNLRLARAQRDQALANLTRLENGSRPEEIEQARAQEANAYASHNRAELDYQRASQLIDDKAISKQEFDAAKSAFLEASAALASAEASRRLVEIGPRDEDIAAGQAQYDAAAEQVIIVERQREDAELRAPHDGIILTRAREAGGIVNPGETVFTLTLDSPVWVRTYVGEPDLGKLQPGMKVVVTTDTTWPAESSGGAAAREYIGHVGFISPTAEFTPKSVETRELRTNLVYRVRIVIENPDGGLRQGMPVTVTVDVPGTQPRGFEPRMLEALGLEWLNENADSRSEAR
jgi:HlyD family secretion protein